MSFELDDRGADEIDARAARDGVPFGAGLEPGFFSGTIPATAKGLYRGAVAKPALLLGDAATPALRGPARVVDRALGTSLDAWLTDQQQRNRQALAELQPDPATTGFAGQVLGGLLDLGASAVLYTPEGAAALEGYARRDELMQKGVDTNTSTVVGAVSGATTLVGIKAPVTLGKSALGQGAGTVVQNLGFGAGASVASGVLDRGTSKEVLLRAGYPDQAAMLEPFDIQTVLAEGVLGALMSGTVSALEMRASAKGQHAIDAALATKATRHRAIDAAPGVPADARSMSAHNQAFGAALRQALANEPVNVGEALADSAFVRPGRGQQEDAAAELQMHVADLLPDPSQASALASGATRGLRNNNPGNVMATADRWEGQTGSDGRFATFETPEAGIRALARTLLTYQEKHGLNTVDGIVRRWAPPGENDTAAYAKAVSKVMGIEPTAKLDLRDPGTLQRLAAAIVRHENGVQPYPDAVMREGVGAALAGRPVVTRGAAPAGPALPPPREGYAMGIEPKVSERDALGGSLARDMARPAESPDGVESSTLAELERLPASIPPDFERAVVQVAAPALPRVTDMQPIAAGPVVVEPREIAPGRQLYRETSIEGLSDLLMDDLRAHVRQLFVADTPDLAIGQGENKGVQVVFREGSLSGAEHTKPATGPGVGREYRTDMVAPRAVESFTVPEGFKPAALRGLARRALAEFTPQPLPEGGFRYLRKPSEVAPARRADGSTPRASTEPDSLPAGTDASPAFADRSTVEPTVRAAHEAAAANPDMLVALADGTEVPASEVMARAKAERAKAESDAHAFEAAVSCFLRNPA